MCCCWQLKVLTIGMQILIIPIYTSVDHSIGAIPMADRKLFASVDGNICWVKFTKFLYMILACRWAPKPSVMAEKPRFRRRTVFAKNLGFDVGFGYRNNTNKLYHCRTWMVQSHSPGGANGHAHLIHGSFDKPNSASQRTSHNCNGQTNRPRPLHL